MSWNRRNTFAVCNNSPRQIQRLTENASSGNGDSGRHQYSADGKSLESSAGTKNTNFEICKIGTLNSATVSDYFLDSSKIFDIQKIRVSVS